MRISPPIARRTGRPAPVRRPDPALRAAAPKGPPPLTVALLAAAFVTACGLPGPAPRSGQTPSPSTPASPSASPGASPSRLVPPAGAAGLLVLLPTPEGGNLLLMSADGAAALVPVPAGATRGLAVSRAGRLAVLDPGARRVALADGPASAAAATEARWSPHWAFTGVPAGGGPLLGAAWSADGERLAVLAGEPGAADGTGCLHVLEVAPGTWRTWPLAVAPAGPTLAWLGPDHLLLTTIGRADRPAAAILDLRSGAVAAGPPGDLYGLALSADGTTAALDVGTAVRVGDAAAWLGDGTLPPVVAEAGDRIAEALAIDAAGGRLAAAWRGSDSGRRTLEVLDRAAGWAPRSVLDLEAAGSAQNGAAPLAAWLP